jgi:hypothetical protein
MPQQTDHGLTVAADARQAASGPAGTDDEIPEQTANQPSSVQLT